MSEHLKDISSYYFLDAENEREVKAISEVDCEIISNLISISERLGSKTLVEILSEWKLSPDVEVLEKLEEYLDSPELEEHMKAKGGDFFTALIDKMKTSYIEIGSFHLHTNKIFIINRVDSHNGNHPIYSIIINDEIYLPTNTNSWYVNLRVDFSSKREREDKLEEIKKLIKKNTMCKFIN